MDFGRASCSRIASTYQSRGRRLAYGGAAISFALTTPLRRNGFAMLRPNSPLSQPELDRINERWRKLTAMVRDPSCTPAERSSFAAKANELSRQVLDACPDPAPKTVPDDLTVSSSALSGEDVPLWLTPIATAFVMHRLAWYSLYRWT